MANAFSQLIASFEREGKFPLEADYIFGTVDDLNAWAGDAIRAATLHEGLLKVVLDDGNGRQGLYWVENDGGTLKFFELIASDCLTSILENSEKLSELLGDIASVKEGLEKLEEETLGDGDSLKEQIKAIAGCIDDDVIGWLESLDYKNLTEISARLAQMDPDGLVSEMWLKIMGDPLPSEPFQTLRGIEDIITKHIIDEGYLHANMVGEINKIETGVGLNADGSYSADPSTRFLTDATSVMHALRILDSLIYKYGSLDIHEAWYDADTEEIVIVIGAGDDTDEWHEIRIPVGDLIREWEPENPDDSPVVLTRTESVEGKDKLSGTLKISSIDNNSLSITEDGELYVDPIPWIEMD